ncbi:MAG: 1-acyl-sn-glycerol-3-phosphate acyltransferase [Bacteroidota bacterium]
MYRLFAKIVFAFTGWKIQGEIPLGIKKYVLIAAPHTSNWDFLYGSCAWKLFGLNVKYLAKKDLFRFPFGIFFRALGGIPVDRNKHNNLIDAMVELINNKNEIIVLMTPEGTRKKVDKWKLGFYYVALKAKVPIVLGKIDYKKKCAFIGTSFIPTGDIQKDFEIIREYYKDASPKNPKNFDWKNVKAK